MSLSRHKLKSSIPIRSIDKINDAVLQMMDYDPAHVELYPEKPNAKDRYVDVTLSMLVKAIGQEKSSPTPSFAFAYSLSII